MISQLVQRLAWRWTDLVAGAREWFLENGFFFTVSTLVHALGLVCLALAAPWVHTQLSSRSGPVVMEAVEVDNRPDDQVSRFEVGAPPLEPGILTTDTLLEFEPPAQTAQHNDDAAEFEEAGGGTPIEAKGPMLGGLGGFSVKDVVGPAGRGGVGFGVGTGTEPGSGGAGSGFGGRGTGHREAMLGAFGGTKAGERAVGAGLNWLHRHQNAAGNWSLQHNRHCAGRPCGGAGGVKSDAAATALALLPFLGAAQTHKSSGPYKPTVTKGITWLIKHQNYDGDLSAGAQQQMYTHGIATIALCEAYGLTKDQFVGDAARKAIRFIEQAQNLTTGAWRYRAGDSGDTSVLGWQVMALKSGQLAGLGVDSQALENTRKWLNSVRRGEKGGLFCYLPYQEATPTMTAVGILCFQYLGTNPEDPMMLEGRQYLLSNLPDNGAMRNSYYWYYATMAMHNFMGPEWDAWNRKMRRILIESQEKGGCATGSWDPENPNPDTWGGRGGRLMTTSFAVLTLEVYYRYLPLFQLNPPEKSPNLARKLWPSGGVEEPPAQEVEPEKKAVVPRWLP